MKYLFQRALWVLLAASLLQSCNTGNGASSAGSVQLKLLDDALRFSSGDMMRQNYLTSKKIEKAAADDGNKPADVAVLQKAVSIQKQVAKTTKYIDKLRNEIISATGGYIDQDPRKMYSGASDISITENIMIGQKKGQELQKEVNFFIDDVNKILGSRNFKYAALGTKDDPRISGLTNKEVDFATFYFENTGMLNTLAELSQLEFEIARVEQAALSEMAALLGAADLKFNEPTIIVMPTSNTIAAGTKYNAEIFLGAAATTVPITIKCRGMQVPVDDNSKRGTYSFTAPGGAYDNEGISRQQYEYTVAYKFNGKDVELKGMQEYFVKKPTIQVTGGPSGLLYRNCGNELNISIPDLSSTYNPSFTATGAEVIKNAEKGSVTLVPTNPSVTLKISSSGNYIGDMKFNTILIPTPTIEIFENGKMVDEKMGEDISTLKNLTVKAISDNSFKTYFPKDARYSVVEWDCILVRGKRPIAVEKMSSETANISDLLKKASPGDRLMIEIKKVIRTNYLNKKEQVDIGFDITNIPLN